MAFWFCESKQYEPETWKGFSGGREVVRASSKKDARLKFQSIEDDITKTGKFVYYRLMLREYGFFGPFRGEKMAKNIKYRHIMKKKRHHW